MGGLTGRENLAKKHSPGTSMGRPQKHLTARGSARVEGPMIGVWEEHIGIFWYTENVPGLRLGGEVDTQEFI